jgi:CheY-like chemotaxis protein
MSWLKSIIESPGNRIPVVALTTNPSDPAALTGLAERAGWSLTMATDLEGAAAALLRHPGAVILCDRDLAGVGWREAAHLLTLCSPEIRFVVLSPETDDRFWLEVIERGGYDVLTRPIHDNRAIVAVRQASLAVRK